MLELRVKADGLVEAHGRLDAAEAERALATLQGQPGPVTLDCARLEYISSAGLAVILQVWKRLNAQGSKLYLVELQPRVRSVFAYAGLDKMLDIR